MKSAGIIFIFCFMLLNAGCSNAQQVLNKNNPYYVHTDNGKLRIADEEWKKYLSATSYHILREKGTEAPETGPYVHNTKKGMYYCAACGHALFGSDTKFDSGTGWPSFFRTYNKASVIELADNAHGMVRTEVVCSRCGGHLGHVFDDGPNPTGLRYCMNGYALSFEPTK